MTLQKIGGDIMTEKMTESPQISERFDVSVSQRLPSGLHVPSLTQHLAVIGANFRTAPITVREELARKITFEKISQLKSRKIINDEEELILLSTCNRVEIYLASENLKAAIENLRTLFLSVRNSMISNFQTYEFYDRQTIEHLFGVAAGLDSLVIGEAQILSQVGEASKKANELGLCGPILSRLFSKACSAGREIRESYPKITNGFQNSISLSVMDLIEGHFQNDAKPNLLLVGSGKMVRLAVNSLKRSHLGKIIVAARRKDFKEFEADRVVSISEIGRTIEDEKIDVVITATSSDSFILSPGDLQSYSKLMNNRILLIVDIAVPRNVDPKVTEISKNIALLNLDDLKERIPENYSTQEPEENARQLGEIRNSILVRSNEFLSWMKESSELSPLMNALRRKAETIRSDELESAFSRLPDLSPSQREVIIRMSERIIRRFLHDPTAKLKELSRNPYTEESKEFTSVVNDLFFLDLDKKILPAKSKEDGS